MQDAILPPLDDVRNHFKETFVLFNPKDVVSGDFYWFEKIAENHALIAAADCTGHGVPGSMVSVVCSGALNRSVNEFGLTEPAAILNKTRELVIETFAKSGTGVRDGMDIALCAIQPNQVVFSGANNPLWLVRKKEKFSEAELNKRGTVTNNTHALIEIAANRQPIGATEHGIDFKQITIHVQPGDALYMFSDGFADQFGETTGKKFKKKPFKELLLHITAQPMQHQKQLLHEAFNVWKGSLEQIDDVCVIGVRV